MMWRTGRSLLCTKALVAVALVVAPTAPAQVPVPSPVAPAAIDPERAAAYFEEARQLSHADAGRLWGRKIYGRMMFVEPATRRVVTNWPNRRAGLTKVGTVYLGDLPASISVGNTMVDWGGKTWSMLVWPLPEDRTARAALLMHECFHRVQSDLDLPPRSPPNLHLDTRDGRASLRLEMRALDRALEAGDDQDASALAISDALVFRAWRRLGLEDAARHENELELNEGLAEYTGLRLCGADEAEQIRRARRTLRLAERGSLMRRFAYATGPAYAFLLDRADPAWRTEITRQSDLAETLRRALKIDLPAELNDQVERRAARYDGAEIFAEERQRHEERAERLARDQARFVDGPVLTIDLTSRVRYTFVQQDLVALDGVGTVYSFARLTGPWGVLTARDGALFMDRPQGRRVVRVPIPGNFQPPEGDTVEVAGWTLRLHEGWSLHPGRRPGDWRLGPSR